MNHLLYLHCSDQNVRTIKSQFCLTSVAHATVGKRYTGFRYTVCCTLAHKLSNETEFDKVDLRKAADHRGQGIYQDAAHTNSEKNNYLFLTQRQKQS